MLSTTTTTITTTITVATALPHITVACAKDPATDNDDEEDPDDVLPEEEWKPIEKQPNYEVSSHGRVRNVWTGRILKQKRSHQYPCVTLRYNSQRKTINIHRLVLAAFVPNDDPTRTLVDHIDRNKTNNVVTNLRWASKSENARNTQLSTASTSGEKGVHWNRHAQKWSAQIMHNGKSIHLGYFADKADAIAARKAAESKFHGAFARA